MARKTNANGTTNNANKGGKAMCKATEMIKVTMENGTEVLCKTMADAREFVRGEKGRYTIDRVTVDGAEKETESNANVGTKGSTKGKGKANGTKGKASGKGTRKGAPSKENESSNGDEGKAKPSREERLTEKYGDKEVRTEYVKRKKEVAAEFKALAEAKGNYISGKKKYANALTEATNALNAKQKVSSKANKEVIKGIFEKYAK